MTEKLRVDLANLTLGMMDEVAEHLDGETLEVAMQGPRRGHAIAAAVYVLRKQDDPSFTYEDALALSPIRDLELVNSVEEPDAPKDNGSALPTLPARGR